MTINRRSLCAQTASVLALGVLSVSGRPRAAVAKSLNTVLSIPQTVKRSRSNDDWLAGAANLAAWQSEIAIGEGTVLQQIRNPQRWRDLFDADTGLAKTDLAAFAVDSGLVVDGRTNQTLEHWHNLLQQSGPLWIGVANQSYKAGQVWVVTGISGDGSAGRTQVNVIALETGEVDAMTAKQFADLYQAAAKADGITGKVDLQVLRAG